MSIKSGGVEVVSRATLVLILAILFCGQSVCAVTINEIRIDQFSSDDDEYFELEGSAGEMLDGLTYLVIGDSAAGLSGVIEAAVSLDKQMIGDDGFFLVTESTFGAPGTAFVGIPTEMTASLNFENADNVTHLLVNGFNGSLQDDLDTNDDGVLDVSPWDSVLDAVGLVESPDMSAPNSEWFYGTALGGSDIGPSGTFVPGHVYRTSNGMSSFTIGEFSLDTGDPGITIDDTPGSSNLGGNSMNDGDFDDNGFYECADVDDLVAEIVSGTHTALFDLTDDGLVNVDDLDAWLAEAGSTGGLTSSGNPVLLGDATLDGNVNGQDFLIWNDHKFSSNAAWCAGDFNADGNVNGQDFLIWNDNKFQTADASAVPEPESLALLMVAALLGRWRTGRK